MGQEFTPCPYTNKHNILDASVFLDYFMREAIDCTPEIICIEGFGFHYIHLSLIKNPQFQ
jgi:hypothetical protein